MGRGPHPSDAGRLPRPHRHAAGRQRGCGGHGPAVRDRFHEPCVRFDGRRVRRGSVAGCPARSEAGRACCRVRREPHVPSARRRDRGCGLRNPRPDRLGVRKRHAARVGCEPARGQGIGRGTDQGGRAWFRGRRIFGRERLGKQHGERREGEIRMGCARARHRTGGAMVRLVQPAETRARADLPGPQAVGRESRPQSARIRDGRVAYRRMPRPVPQHGGRGGVEGQEPAWTVRLRAARQPCIRCGQGGSRRLHGRSPFRAEHAVRPIRGQGTRPAVRRHRQSKRQTTRKRETR